MALWMEAARIFVLYGVPALIAAGSVILSVLLLRRMRLLHSKLLRGEEELKSATATWARSLAAMGKEVETIAEAAKHPATDSGASAATRRKVLKLHRLGNSAENIAQALRLSKGEVILLLKVHTMILRPFEQPPEEREIAVLGQKP